MDIEIIAPAAQGRLIVKRRGSSITRSIPKPVVIIDSREQMPFEFTNLKNWIGSTQRRKLDAEDYSLVSVIYTSQYRPLAEEKAASWLSKHFTYWHLEKAGLGRVLQPGDL